MLSQNNNALGIIFPNSYDTTVPELVTERAMASIPFAGRYRMVDFILSSMANCGISNVSIVVRKTGTVGGGGDGGGGGGAGAAAGEPYEE